MERVCKKKGTTHHYGHWQRQPCTLYPSRNMSFVLCKGERVLLYFDYLLSSRRAWPLRMTPNIQNRCFSHSLFPPSPFLSLHLSSPSSALHLHSSTSYLYTTTLCSLLLSACPLQLFCQPFSDVFLDLVYSFLSAPSPPLLLLPPPPHSQNGV